MPTSAVCSDGSVVDPVAHVADHVPACFERKDDPVLLFRRHAGKDGAVLRLVGQSGVVHGVDFAAGDDAVRFQPHVAGDLLGHIPVVAGHDDDRDAVLLERFENGRNPLLGRVQESRETGQGHVLFGRHRVGVLLVYLPNGDPQNAESVGAQLLEGLRGLSSPAFVERLGRPSMVTVWQMAKILSASPLVTRRHSSPLPAPPRTDACG